MQQLSPNSDDDSDIQQLATNKNYVTNNVQSCPSFPSLINGTWTILKNNDNSTKHSWLWTNQNNEISYNLTPSSPQIDNNNNNNVIPYFQQRHPIFLRPDKNTNNVSVVFYGSSHIRELYLSMIRLLHGFPENDTLPRYVKDVGSAVNWKSKECVPDGSWKGLQGINIDVCGPPGRRVVPELGSNQNVAIGFKTFLHTPVADEHFLDWLLSVDNNGSNSLGRRRKKKRNQYKISLRRPQVLIVDLGVWGARGNTTSGLDDATQVALTPDEEIDYFIGWLDVNFPTSQIVAVVDELSVKETQPHFQSVITKRLEEHVSSWNKNNENSRWTLLRKDHLLKDRPYKDFHCTHGCAGPLLDLLALILNDWLIDASKSGCLFG
jgi:hypothetical protein